LVGSSSPLRSPPPETQRRIDLHQRWLRTGGLLGARIGSDEALVDLSGLILDGVDLSLGILSNAEFKDCSLRGSWFLGAELDEATFVGCDLHEARFDRAHLVCASFVGADCSSASFDQAVTQGTEWTRADVEANVRRWEYEVSAKGQNLQHDDPRFYSDDQQRIHEAAVEDRQVLVVRENLELWRHRKGLAAPQP
jgi:Pentapeptide repeats (9 copies)